MLRIVPRKRFAVLAMVAGAVFAVCNGAFAQLRSAPGTPAPVRIAFIDPLSGPFANTGESALKHFRAAFERTETTRVLKGARVELVPLDNKASAQEALVQLRAAADQGIRYVLQGQSSAAALALVDAIDKHNARNPGREMLLLNYAALDPDLTNAKCSFWLFRFDASVDMRMEALVEAIVRDGRAKNLYLVGQDYSFGRHVARAAREMLARKLPAARVVGEDLHPIGTVRDFSPYIAKIKAAGADAVITGNWGTDLALLVKSAREMGFNGDFYTFYAGSPGAVTAIGKAGVGRLKQVNEWHPNVVVGGKRVLAVEAGQFRQRYAEDLRYLRFFTLADMFAAAVVKAGTIEPLQVARALEGLRLDTPTGEVQMRALDHQLIQPLYVSTLALVAAQGGPKDVVADTEQSGTGFQTNARIEGYATAQPTTCAMVRPAPGSR